MIIVDIGALKTYRPSDEHTVYFVQPDPVSYIRMIMELEEKEINNITVLPFAMSNKTGVATLHLREFPEGHSLKERLLEPIIGSYEVPTLTWDDFVKEFNISTVDLLIVDAEGSEEDILEGMTTVFPKLIKMAGYHSGKFKNVKTCEELQKQLIEKGYKIIGVKNEPMCAEIEAVKL